MRYALFENQRIEATKGLVGECVCQLCGKPVIAKCGEIRSWHWAHASGQACDSWQSPMTEWHRAWQDRFPEECREVPLTSPTGRHIADVLVPARDKKTRLVIEFQHSAIKPEDRKAREDFYGKMIWVIDGERTKTAADHVRKINDNVRSVGNGLFALRNAETCLPPAWLGSTVPVFFDFNDFPLLCVFPIQLNRKFLLACFRREDFVQMANSGTLRKWLNVQQAALEKLQSESSISADILRSEAATPQKLKAWEKWYAKEEMKRHRPLD